MKNMIELLTELQTINERIDKIQNDPEYIESKAREVFKGKSYKVDPAAITAIVNECLA